MFISKRHMPAPDVPARRRRDHCAAAARRDGARDGVGAEGAVSRYSFLHVPHGASPPYWKPTGEARIGSFRAILQPLAPFKDRLTVISNTDHAMAGSLSPEESAGDHSRTAAVYLSGSHPKRTEGQDIYAGVTIDQVIAAQDRPRDPLPSLEMCIEDVGSLGVCGVGYSCAYYELDLLVVADLAAAHGAQPAGRVRAAVRRRRHVPRSAPRASARTAASSIPCSRTRAA